MAWTLERSNRHFERALERLPLGVASDCGYWGDGRTVYVKRANGARLWDIDDNEYIDYRLGCGRVILGYADPRVARAARAGIESRRRFRARHRTRVRRCGADRQAGASRRTRALFENWSRSRRGCVAVGAGLHRQGRDRRGRRWISRTAGRRLVGGRPSKPADRRESITQRPPCSRPIRLFHDSFRASQRRRWIRGTIIPPR